MLAWAWLEDLIAQADIYDDPRDGRRQPEAEAATEEVGFARVDLRRLECLRGSVNNDSGGSRCGHGAAQDHEGQALGVLSASHGGFGRAGVNSGGGRKQRKPKSSRVNSVSLPYNCMPPVNLLLPPS